MKIELKCKHCGRHIGWALGTTIINDIICPNTSCKKRLNFKIVNSKSSDEDVHFKFDKDVDKNNK